MKTTTLINAALLLRARAATIATILGRMMPEKLRFCNDRVNCCVRLGAFGVYFFVVSTGLGGVPNDAKGTQSCTGGPGVVHVTNGGTANGTYRPNCDHRSPEVDSTISGDTTSSGGPTCGTYTMPPNVPLDACPNGRRTNDCGGQSAVPVRTPNE